MLASVAKTLPHREAILPCGVNQLHRQLTACGPGLSRPAGASLCRPVHLTAEEPTIQERRIDGLICALLVLSTVAAVLSSVERPNGFYKQARSLMLTESASEAAIDAEALGDVRYLDVSP